MVQTRGKKDSTIDDYVEDEVDIFEGYASPVVENARKRRNKYGVAGAVGGAVTALTFLNSLWEFTMGYYAVEHELDQMSDIPTVISNVTSALPYFETGLFYSVATVVLFYATKWVWNKYRENRSLFNLLEAQKEKTRTEFYVRRKYGDIGQATPDKD